MQKQNHILIPLRVNNFISALLSNFFIDRKYIFFDKAPIVER